MGWAQSELSVVFELLEWMKLLIPPELGAFEDRPHTRQAMLAYESLIRSPERHARQRSHRFSGLIHSAEDSPSERAADHAPRALDLSTIVVPAMAVEDAFKKLPPIQNASGTRALL